MKKDEYRELMILSVYGELTPDEQHTLDRYMASHPELKTEFEHIRRFQSFVSGHSEFEVPESMVQEARQQLRKTLRSERQEDSFIQKTMDGAFSWFSPKVQIAVGGIAVLAVGILVGRWLVSPVTGLSPSGSGDAVLQTVSHTNSTIDKETKIENVRFIDADASDGVIEFEFEAVAPMHLKGKVSDPEIQKILTYALLNESNDGVRLKTMNAIAEQAEMKKTVDPAIKSALITTLKTDENPGVRQDAVRVLSQYPFDNDIRDAMLYVLTHDSNAGIRVSAVNALELAKIDGYQMGDTVISTLKHHMHNEQNNYVRNRTATLVKEIYQ